MGGASVGRLPKAMASGAASVPHPQLSTLGMSPDEDVANSLLGVVVRRATVQSFAPFRSAPAPLKAVVINVRGALSIDI